MTQPCGTWTITDIPEAEVGAVIADCNLDSPSSVTRTKQPDGKWTVTAVYADCPPGQPNSSQRSHGS
ncbi:MAG TPA: hypothetical protein VEA60_07195 [Allosphingosinicella sp.]|nr:hypothetical protein [Allosphingosinicella sp.]